jgi:hypothetical protein
MADDTPISMQPPADTDSAPSPMPQPPDLSPGPGQSASPDRGEQGAPIDPNTSGGEATWADVLKHGQELVTQAEKDTAEYQKAMIPLYKQAEAMIKEPMPQMPQPPEYAPPPSLQQNRRQLGTSALQYLAIALPLAAMMGSKGGWAMAGAWGGLGKGLSALVQGNQDQYDQSLKNWAAINDHASAKFHDQQETYRSILANRKYTQSQMMDLIGMVSKQYGDKQLADAANIKNWQGMMKSLMDRQKAEQQFEEKRAKILTDIEKATGTNDSKNYRMDFEQKYGFDPFKYPRTKREDALVRQHPLSSWFDEHKKKKNESNIPPGAPGAEKGADTSTSGDESGDDDVLGIKTPEKAAQIKSIFGQ